MLIKQIKAFLKFVLISVFFTAFFDFLNKKKPGTLNGVWALCQSK